MSDLTKRQVVTRLTEAAEHLRHRARGVMQHSPSPNYTSACFEADSPDHTPAWFEADVDLRNAIRGTFQGNHASAPDDARWIALMSPQVGLAMADVLDSLAMLVEAIYIDHRATSIHNALGLADRILEDRNG